MKGSSPNACFQCVFRGLAAQVHEFGNLMVRDFGTIKEQGGCCVKKCLRF